jgi:sortase (surface protein transpeptidase)
MRRRVAVIVVAGAAGAALVAAGVWSLVHDAGPDLSGPVEIPTNVVTHSVDSPDERPAAAACAELEVEGAVPRRIDLPSIDASGCMIRVGVDQHRAIAVPTNINLAGWYVEGPSPGEPGVSIVDGHVSGAESPGIFARLGDLRAGDPVTIERGDGTVLTFTVVTVDSYPTADTAREQFRALPGVERQLTLITCGGRYDPAIGTHDQRIVVRAELDD